MMIRRLTLHNFGVYAGTNSFHLSGKKGKPIVLIGGLNGRGKTTFLEAVLIALYGTNSFAYKESSYTTYGQYLKSYVNTSDGTKQSYVEMEFQLSAEEHNVYTVRREWDGESQRIKEKTTVWSNGEKDEFLTSNWPMFIENILPSGLSNFFFFDGEKIAEMALDVTDAQMKESIRSLLGISVLDKLKKDITRNINSVKKQKNKADETGKLDTLREAKEQAQKKLEDIDKKIDDTQAQLSKKKRDLEKVTNEYIAQGGDIIEQRQELYQKRTTLIALEEQNTEALITETATELPLLLIKGLLKKIKTQSDKEQEQQLLEKALEVINNMHDEYRSTIGKVKSGASDFVDFVNTKGKKNGKKSVYNLTESAAHQISELLSTRLDAEKDSTCNLLNERIRLKEELDKIDNNLSVDINENEAKKSYKRIKELERGIIDSEVQLKSLQQQRSNANGEYIRTSSEYGKYVERVLHSMEVKDDKERILKYSNMAAAIIDEYAVRLQKRKTDVLAETITDCYRKLFSKKNLIRRIAMDPVTLNLTFYDAKNKEIKKSRMSAGENQLIVVSILWALAICSKSKLPVIIDTPLSRLDSNHRKALITKYFPNASEQTIILSTDAEIDAEAYQMMKKNVGDEFILNYDDTSQTTTIQKGYFLGEAV